MLQFSRHGIQGLVRSDGGVGSPSRLRLLNDGIGSLPRDITQRRPELGDGERRRREDVVEGDPVMHWHLLMHEGMIWQHLGLHDVEQPWLWPLPLQLHLCGGGGLLLEQGQSQARMMLKHDQQEQGGQAQPRASPSMVISKQVVFGS